MMACRGALAAIGVAVGGTRVGNTDDDEQQRHQRTHRAGHDQGAMAADRCDQGCHRGRRDGTTKEPGKGVDRKGAAHAGFIHMGRQDRIVGRMVDAVGEAQQHRACDQPGIAQMQPEHDQREAAEGEAHQQDLAGADMIGQIADRRLGQAGDDGKNRQRQTELDIADAELLLQEGKQHRQHEQMEMTDPMGRRDRGKRPQRRVGFCLLRCGQNVDHLLLIPRLLNGPAGQAETIG